ncbi:MAG: hypothetical protein AAF603_06000 [Pseudomonadota bacterium]
MKKIAKIIILVMTLSMGIFFLLDRLTDRRTPPSSFEPVSLKDLSDGHSTEEEE